jgi:hypothetical protein
MSNENHGSLWWLLIGWWYTPLKEALADLAPTLTPPTSAPQDPTPEPPNPELLKSEPLTDTPQPKVEHHRIAGTSFRLDAIKELLDENPDYPLNKRELIDQGLTDERIYKMEVYNHSAVLEPEPENPTDPKAIKVLTEGVHIGYIKAGPCAHIHKALREGRIESAEIEIKGGEYKILLEDVDEDGESVYSLERATVPFSAVLSLTLK